MKILLTLFILFFSSSAVSGDGDLYICKTVNLVKAYKYETKEFRSFDFNFKKNKDSIIFGKGGYFDEGILPINNSAGEYFDGGKEWTRFIYNDGLFMFVSLVNTDERQDVLTIIADCKLF
tara:strand:+ start:951 stop:1310 length:360 start_codon:yes stop_codon:yes gene_type:complete